MEKIKNYGIHYFCPPLLYLIPKTLMEVEGYFLIQLSNSEVMTLFIPIAFQCKDNYFPRSL